MTALRIRLTWGLQVFALLLPVWLVLDGTGSLWVGIGAAALGALFGAAVAPAVPYGWRPWQLLAFAGFFLKESLLGAVDVAWRALHPRLPIEPRLERYVVSLPAGTPSTLLAGVVSLLPGTLSADLSDDSRQLLIHAITGEAEASVRRLEARIADLFGLSPGAGQ
jgi:multicomponent Na+:H+ antiporter subunit E